MSKQILISINRTYGSGGHEIGRQLAERLGVDFMDRELLDRIAEEKGVDAKNLEKYDERRKIPFLSRTVRGYSNSPEDAVAEMQFNHILKKAEKGESFVVVGRCADRVLKDYDELVTIFVTGKLDSRIQRIMEVRNVEKARAHGYVRKHDRNRKAYHNHYTSAKWNDMSHYDLCVSTTPLGIEKTVDFLMDYLKTRGVVANEEQNS